MERTLDVLLSALGLLLMSPVLAVFALAVWSQDFRWPFYVAERVGLGGDMFRMVKLRSMVMNAESSGVTSTSDTDRRITAIGRLTRRLKLDELTQLWNVLLGDMSLVGPRPNVVKWGVELYTTEEMRLLSVRPGITDFSSIVFADEGVILSGTENPDLAYNQLIRPWKSRLSLFYVDKRDIALYFRLIYLTAVSLVNRASALRSVSETLKKRGAPEDLVNISLRKQDLVPHPPPGAVQIVDTL